MKNTVQITRRQAITGGVVGISLQLAGCVNNNENKQSGKNSSSSENKRTNNTVVDSNDNDNGKSEANNDHGENNTRNTEGNIENKEESNQNIEETEMAFEIKQIGATAGAPTWARRNQNQPGVVFLYESINDGQSEHTIVSQFDDDEIKKFINETDFETQRLIHVESVGPTGCYDRIEFDGLAVKDSMVVGKATATTPGGNTACTQVITYPRALVRVDAIVDAVALEVTDGQGKTKTVRQ